MDARALVLDAGDALTRGELALLVHAKGVLLAPARVHLVPLLLDARLQNTQALEAVFPRAGVEDGRGADRSQRNVRHRDSPFPTAGHPGMPPVS